MTEWRREVFDIYRGVCLDRDLNGRTRAGASGATGCFKGTHRVRWPARTRCATPGSLLAIRLAVWWLAQYGGGLFGALWPAHRCPPPFAGASGPDHELPVGLTGQPADQHPCATAVAEATGTYLYRDPSLEVLKRVVYMRAPRTILGAPRTILDAGATMGHDRHHGEAEQPRGR